MKNLMPTRVRYKFKRVKNSMSLVHRGGGFMVVKLDFDNHQSIGPKLGFQRGDSKSKIWQIPYIDVDL